MDIEQLDIPESLKSSLRSRVKELRPAQEKAVKSGLLDDRSLLICTPTASGKTLIAEIGILRGIINHKKKAVYIVPLKALASEKYREFQKNHPGLRIALSVGDMDRDEGYLAGRDLIVTTSEKLDSLIRHRVPWLHDIGVIVIDEIHLLNDPGRGPTLEIIITLLRRMLPKAQLIGLSATIGNPKELADWLGATLIEDTWRPVKLKQGIYRDGKIEFSENS